MILFCETFLGLSYKNLFRQLSEERSSDYYFERGFMYDPNGLDDPEMLHGEHRYVQHPASITGDRFVAYCTHPLHMT